MTLISPRARDGLRMFAPSTAPSEAPAPIRVCISSINRITDGSLASEITSLSRSSKSPLYLAPASNSGRSREKILFPQSSFGTSFLTIIEAIPSTTAVLPTPGSPTRQGLFLFRRQRICKSRSLSASLPTKRSSFPRLASAVRSLPYFSKEGKDCSSFSDSRPFPKIPSMASI